MFLSPNTLDQEPPPWCQQMFYNLSFFLSGCYFILLQIGRHIYLKVFSTLSCYGDFISSELLFGLLISFIVLELYFFLRLWNCAVHTHFKWEIFYLFVNICCSFSHSLSLSLSLFLSFSTNPSLYRNFEVAPVLGIVDVLPKKPIAACTWLPYLL